MRRKRREPAGEAGSAASLLPPTPAKPVWSSKSGRPAAADEDRRAFPSLVDRSWQPPAGTTLRGLCLLSPRKAPPCPEASTTVVAFRAVSGIREQLAKAQELTAEVRLRLEEVLSH